MALLDRLFARISPRSALRRSIRLTERGDVKGAFPLLSRAAQAGIAEAEHRIGRCYLEGAGVPVSRLHGARWLERAATQGYIESQTLLATLYLHGMAAEAAGSDSAHTLFAANAVSADPDFTAAEKWARRAADGGSADGPGDATQPGAPANGTDAARPAATQPSFSASVRIASCERTRARSSSDENGFTT